MHAMLNRRLLIVVVFSLLIGPPRLAQATLAIPIDSLHDTNGSFGFGTPNEWTVSSTNGDPARSTVSELVFPQVGNSGGAVLYVEQGLHNLYLMYDYVNSQSILGPGANASNSFFDVFFQIPSESNDYAVQIGNSGFSVFEKVTGTVSGLNPDGSLNLLSAPWTPVASNDPDFVLANFQAAIGFGPSPNNPNNHVLAEFQLSINRGQGSGFYDPAPAFWSASSGTVGADPPISSGIFMLNPNGTTTVLPALGANGDPVLQPQDMVAIPEPATLVMAATGALAILGYRRLLRKPTV